VSSKVELRGVNKMARLVLVRQQPNYAGCCSPLVAGMSSINLGMNFQVGNPTRPDSSGIDGFIYSDNRYHVLASHTTSGKNPSRGRTPA
jgi:hypothetical protein